MQYLIEAIAGLYLLLAIFNGEYRPKRNIFIVLFGFFAAILFLASFFGVDFYRSFWGAEERFTGLIFIFHLALFSFVIISLFRTKGEWARYLGFNALVAIVMLSIASLSLFGVKFWGVDLGRRISGTLGNPIFLGAYFILNLVFAFFLLFASSGRGKKFFWLIVVLALGYGIILTQSRGAFVGLIGGISSGFIYYSASLGFKKAKLIIFSVLGASVVCAGIFYTLAQTAFLKESAIFNRLTQISLAATTNKTRLLGWEIALKAIGERPFLGWGNDCFLMAFNKHYNPALLKYSYYETWFDRPHNKILEVGADAGLSGLLAYLSLFAAAIYFINAKRKSNKIFLSAASVLFGGLSAYFIQNLFAFDTIVSNFLFIVLLAFIFFGEDTAANNQKRVPIVFFISTIAAVGVLGGLLNVSPILASAAFRGDAALLDTTSKANIANFKNASRYFNPYKDEWRTDLAKNIIASLKRKEDIYSEQERSYAVEELKKSAKAHPNDAYYHMLLGGLYAELGARDRLYFDLAKNELDKALALSPKRQHILMNYGRLYSLTRDKASLIKVFNETIELEPHAALAYWEAFKQLHLLDPLDPQNMKWLIKALYLGIGIEDNEEFLYIFKSTYKYFFERKSYKILRYFYDRMSVIESKNAEWPAQSAMAAYMMGDKADALSLVRRAMLLDENYRKEGEGFVKLIEGK